MERNESGGSVLQVYSYSWGCEKVQQFSRGRIRATARHARHSNTGEMRKKYFVTAAREQSATHRWN
jgi:hypothetical protein